jgi:hypothetical protein
MYWSENPRFMSLRDWGGYDAMHQMISKADNGGNADCITNITHINMDLSV